MKNILVVLALSLISISGNSQSIGADKVTHFLAGGAITSTTYITLNRYDISVGKKTAISIGVGVLGGIVKETYDLSRGGKFDGKDILATGLGSISVTIPIGIGNKKR
jgi:hypothetical protein